MEKEIEGFKGYTIDEYGNVRSYKYDKNGKILKPFISKGGYCYIDLSKNHIKYRFAIHHLVAKNFINSYFEGAVINHKDANKTNNYYKNLEWVTQKENINKSYITSGIDATRNYNWYCIKNTITGKTSKKLKGYVEVKEYIKENKLKISVSSLQKYRKCKEYELIVLPKNSND